MFLNDMFTQELLLANFLTIGADKHGLRKRSFTIVQEMLLERLFILVRDTAVWTFILARLVRARIRELIHIVIEMGGLFLFRAR